MPTDTLPPIGIEDYGAWQSDQFGQTTDAMLATLDKPPAPTPPPIVADQADRATPPTPPAPALPDAASISSPIDASASPPAAPAAPAMAPAQPPAPDIPAAPPAPDDLSPALNAASAAGVDPGVFIAAHQSGHVDPNNWFDSATQLAGHIKDAGGDLVQGLAAFTGSATNAAKVLDRAVANLNPAPAPVATTPDNSAQGATQTTAELSGGGKAVPLGDAAHAVMSAAANSAAWLGEQGQKALQAILVTEGGMTGARGDQGNSAGPLQFYSGGQLANFAQQHGLTQDAAKTYVEAHPQEAVAWAIGSPDHPGYLGSALAAGLQKGLSGPALATYGQQHGQVSVSPERAGQNWNALFGKGSGPFTTAASTNLSTNPSTANSVSQFGDPQLTTDEAYAACGPAAAVRFAQAEGRNPTLREATDLAKSVGWTSAAGMAGLQSEKALMDKLQIPTRVVSGAAWDAFSREAQTGNPVTISTAGHYFYADGFNPDTGAFHVGQSGLDLKGGSEWMTPAQMTARMGPVQGGLLADNPNISNPSTVMGANQPADRQDRADASASNQPSSTGNSALDWLGQQKDALASSIGNAASGVGTAVSGAVDAAGQNLNANGNQEAAYLTSMTPEQQRAAVSALLPQSPSDVLGMSAGEPTGGDQLTAQRNEAIAQTNPLKDVPVVGGATTMAAQAVLDPTNLLLAGEPGVAKATGTAARGALDTGLEALDRISPPDVAFASTAAGPVDRATAESTPAALRFFHGTGSDFAVPDGAKFDPNGLFGPGYYMTDSPVVAGGLVTGGPTELERELQMQLARKASGLSDRQASLVDQHIADLQQQIADQQANGGALSASGYAQRRNATDPVLAALQQRLAKFQDQARNAASQAERDSAQRGAANVQRIIDNSTPRGVGPNVRAIDVPQDLNLFNVDAPVTPELRQNVVDALAASTDPMDQARALRIEYWEKRNGTPLTGEGVWKTLSEESPARATQILSDAGYDGIQYQGGLRTPMQDAAGNPIQHTAINVFPSSLDKLRNAISGTQGGAASAQFASTLGGAAAGGGAAYQTTDPNDPNRGLKIAGGALAGGLAGNLAGYGAARGAGPALDAGLQALDRLRPPDVAFASTMSGPQQALNDARQAVADLAARFPKMSPGSLAASGPGKQLAALEADAAANPEKYVPRVEPATPAVSSPASGLSAEQEARYRELFGDEPAPAVTTPAKVPAANAPLKIQTTQTAPETPRQTYGPGNGVLAEGANGATQTATLEPGWTTIPGKQGGAVPPKRPSLIASSKGPVGEAPVAPDATEPFGHTAASRAGITPETVQIAHQRIDTALQSDPTRADMAHNELDQMLSIPAAPDEVTRFLSGDVEGHTVSPTSVLRSVRTGSMAGGLTTMGKVALGPVVQVAMRAPVAAIKAVVAGRAGDIPTGLQGGLGALAEASQDVLQTARYGTSYRAALTGGAQGGYGFAPGLDVMGKNVAQRAAGRAALGLVATHGMAGDLSAAIGRGAALATGATPEAAAETGQQWALRSGNYGTVGQAVSDALEGLKRTNPALNVVGQILVPFYRVGYNAFTQGVERSPVGLVGTAADVARSRLPSAVGPALRGPYAAGADASHVTPVGDRLANNLFGVGLAGVGLAEAAQGNITGENPQNDAPKWSVLIAGQWVPLRAFGPAGEALAQSAILYESARDGKGNIPKAAETAAAEYVGHVNDETWLRSIGDTFSALGAVKNLASPKPRTATSASKKLAYEGGSIGESFIPQQALGSQIVKAITGTTPASSSTAPAAPAAPAIGRYAPRTNP